MTPVPDPLAPIVPHDTETNARLQRLYRDYLAQASSRSFDLAHVYPDTEQIPVLLAQVDDLKKCLDSFRPLSSEQAKNLDTAFGYQYTYDSNRIEGNTLTLRETTLILEKGMTIAGKSLREHLEVTNHAHALDYIKILAEQGADFNDHMLRSIHQLVLAGIDPQNAGQYRTVDVAIAGSSHIPPFHYLIPQEMAGYFAFYEQQKDQRHPVLLAADLHEKLVTIHPFIDGNGRTARLVMNLILLRHGYPIANISGDSATRQAYYRALEQINQTGDTNLFYRLILKAVKQSAFWYLAFVSTTDDAAKGTYFFARIAPYLEGH